MGSMVSPMAWTRSCGSDPQWWGWENGLSACDICSVGWGLVPGGRSTIPTAETISRSNDGGKGSAVRLACFFRIFRVASLLA